MSAPSSHRILVPLDGSAHAGRAAEFAMRCAAAIQGCELLLVHAQPAASSSVPTSEARSSLAERADELSAAVRSLLNAADVRHQVRAEFGEPAEVIARLARSERIDEIVMASRGMSQWQGLVIGSVAYGVIHRVSIPVTIVPARSAGTDALQENAQRLLLAVDGSPHALRAAAYAIRMQAIRMQGARGELEIDLLNVVRSMPDGYARRFLDQNMLAEYCREEGEAALRPAKEILQSASMKFHAHITTGHVAEKIVEFAGRFDCGRIVMGTRGLGTIAGLSLGSVAYQVLHLATLPVTLVR